MRATIAAVLVASAHISYSFQSTTAVSSEGFVQGRVIEAKSDPPIPIKKALVVMRRAHEPGVGGYTDEGCRPALMLLQRTRWSSTIRLAHRRAGNPPRFSSPESTMPFEERAKAVSIAEGGRQTVELEAVAEDQ